MTQVFVAFLLHEGANFGVPQFGLSLALKLRVGDADGDN